MMKKIIALTGPTASGKTKLGVELAKKINAEIISCDSRLIYEGFEIGAAKPSQKELDAIKHHLVNIIPPNKQFSCALFCEMATKTIDDIFKSDKNVIIVGGTYLYLKALLENYNIPKVEPNFELRKKLEKEESSKLYSQLQKLDYKLSLKVHPNNKRRIIRSIEIINALNQSISTIELKEEENKEVKWFGLNSKDRNFMYNRANLRVDSMFSDGLIEETHNLIKKYGKTEIILNTIGYREINGYFENLLTQDEAKEKIKQHTRNYIKRQISFFKQNNKIKWYNIDEINFDEILNNIYCEIISNI